MKKLSTIGINLIKNFEGCRLKAYKPVETEKFYTIGYGHYGDDVSSGMTISQEKADSMLLIDLFKYESYVNNPLYCVVTNELNQGQFDALVSFCYNCGAGSLKQLCMNRTIDEIGNDMLLYNKGGDNVLQGLVRRRKAEQDLYFKEGKEMNEEIVKLQAQVNEHGKLIQQLMKEKSSIVVTPDWAKSAVDKAVKFKVIETPVTGSYDFYRLLVILDRMNLIKEMV